MPSLIKQINIPNTCIIKWTGLIANIPKNFQICDGTNGTPDLRSKFIRGAPCGNNAGATGGSDTVTLTTCQIPSHNHGVTNPTHHHGTCAPFATQFQAGGHCAPRPAASSTGSSTASITINNAGGGTAHNNKPQYFEVIYIAKINTR